MWTPSFTGVLSVVFLAYMANSLWSIASLYLPPSCASPEELKAAKAMCLKSYIHKRGKPYEGSRFLVFTTKTYKPGVEKDLRFVDAFDVAPLSESLTKEIAVELPYSVTNENGTLYLAVFTIPIHDEIRTKLDKAKSLWNSWIKHPDATYSITTLTKYHIPEAKTFQLLNDGMEEDSSPTVNVQDRVPVAHMKSRVRISIMTEDVEMQSNEVPAELLPLVRIKSGDGSFLPIVYVDELGSRLRDLVRVNASTKSVKSSTPASFDFEYEPVSFGKLRLFSQFSSALSSMGGLGFTDKDTDEVKGIFADTNLALLLITFAVSAVHLLFDFLAFKNDISFWRNRTDMVGLSTRTLLWRAFSQTIIFFYLMDEETSLLVLIPSGMAAVIEMWKVTKAFRVDFVGWRPSLAAKGRSSGEVETEEYDSESMRYLSYVLYPLCAGGAVYSLLYTPHKSWWSWTIGSLANGVYAFGFLFMLPQLFVNYRLKSVAHLPWRAFTYKAFNTFIDDLFAFIITMPTAHRVACFRDDVVFIVYLYQRYLYPVDKTRLDMSAGIIEDKDEKVDEPKPAILTRSRKLKAKAE